MTWWPFSSFVRATYRWLCRGKTVSVWHFDTFFVVIWTKCSANSGYLRQSLMLGGIIWRLGHVHHNHHLDRPVINIYFSIVSHLRVIFPVLHLSLLNYMSVGQYNPISLTARPCLKCHGFLVRAPVPNALVRPPDRLRPQVMAGAQMHGSLE